jgi:hypothetical protein
MNSEKIIEDADNRLNYFTKMLGFNNCFVVSNLDSLIKTKNLNDTKDSFEILLKNSDEHNQILDYLKNCKHFCFLYSDIFRHHLDFPDGLYHVLDPIFILFEEEHIPKEKMIYMADQIQNISSFIIDDILYKAKFIISPTMINREIRILKAENLLILNDYDSLEDFSFMELNVKFSPDFKYCPISTNIIITDDNKIVHVNNKKILLPFFDENYLKFEFSNNYEFKYLNNTIIITNEEKWQIRNDDLHSIMSLWFNCPDRKIINKVNAKSRYNA